MTNDSYGYNKIIQELLHCDQRPIRDAVKNQNMCDSFCNVILSKIAAIATKIHSILDSSRLPTSIPLDHGTPTRFIRFIDVSDDKAIWAILHISAKTTLMDYISTSILKGACDVFGPLIVKLSNLSFSQGNFPTMFKVGQVTPVPKKPGISVDDTSDHRIITNLNIMQTFLSN